MSNRSKTVLAGAGIALAGLAFAIAGAAHAAVTISSTATQNMTCSNGVCAPTEKNATLNAGDLENLLASGIVTVTTTGSGVEASDIRITDTFTWSNTSTLALSAHRSINVNKPVTITGAGGLAVTDGGPQMLSFGPKGNVTFANLSSVLSINGASYTLENTIKALSSAIKGNPGGNYALAASYDASKDGTYSASPIATTFTGTLEGLGNSISNLSISDSTRGDPVGLFAQIESSGVVADLNLLVATMISKGQYSMIGTIAAFSDGLLYGDSATGTMIDGKSSDAGGLVGAQSAGVIASSHTNVAIQIGGFGYGGGIVGLQQPNASINKCYAEGSVNSGGSAVGGLLGFGSNIYDSFSSGDVTGGRATLVGGLAGGAAQGVISNSYAIGSVKGGDSSDVGGLVGWDDDGNGLGGSISSSYSTGSVSGKSGSAVGGFAGKVQASGTTSDDYWDTTTSGTNTGVGSGDATGITGLTSQQLQSGLPQGFDPKIWGQNANVNDGFPYLLANPPPK